MIAKDESLGLSYQRVLERYNLTLDDVNEAIRNYKPMVTKVEGRKPHLKGYRVTVEDENGDVCPIEVDLYRGQFSIVDPDQGDKIRSSVRFGGYSNARRTSYNKARLFEPDSGIRKRVVNVAFDYLCEHGMIVEEEVVHTRYRLVLGVEDTPESNGTDMTPATKEMVEE